jgi:uncharacterized protein YyaL (SSP411 family)
MRYRRLFFLALFFASPLSAAPLVNSTMPWREWGDDVFAQAKRENKFVILSLQAWWCNPCHQMNTITYEDKDVRALLDKYFIPVYVDQDSRPDISQRYENWGWPATVIFHPDGTELVKLRGFYSPRFFIPVLKETIADPTPVNYGSFGGHEREASKQLRIPQTARVELLATLEKAYDKQNGGWGRSKLVDLHTLTYALERAKSGDKTFDARTRFTMTQYLKMIDPQSGGISQITRKPDWSEPLAEFPMFAQEGGLRAFSQAYALWADAGHRKGADRIYGFLVNTMQAPNGGFYASMGHEPHNPGVDRRQYTRETAQAISALAGYYDATGERGALDHAVDAANWVLKERAAPGGGFRHSKTDRGGPFLSDNIEITKAFLSLHRSSGERTWLERAQQSADFVAKHFIDSKTGGFVTTAKPAAVQLVVPTKQKDDNVTAVRVFTLLAAYTGNRRYREIAETGMGYLTSPAVLEAYIFLPDVLLAEAELTEEPVHVTVVGRKDDPAAQALYRAALAYPASFKRAEWWDEREGKLPNHDVDYPPYPKAAAFACTSTFCSRPVTNPKDVRAQLDRLTADPSKETPPSQKKRAGV